MRVACNPNAVPPLATPGPVRAACRAAATRAECAAAAGALGLVEYGRNAPPIPQSVSLTEAAEAQAESPGEGPAAGGKMAVGEAAARAECARADTVRCEWLQVAEEDEGVCVADAGASAAVQRQRQLDVEDAVCMADNGYIEGTQQLTGCQQGHTFCMSVLIEEAPASYACMHAAVEDPEEHGLWFYHYLTCSGPVRPGWEAFCSLARSKFYSNLGCPECAAAADAAAPHQALCASAASEAACNRLTASLSA